MNTNTTSTDTNTTNIVQFPNSNGLAATPSFDISQLENLGNSVLLMSGEKINFDASEESIDLLSSDTKQRGEDILWRIFILGHNLLVAKEQFLKEYGGSDKDFLKIIAEKSGVPIPELKKRISVAENYTVEDIKLLALKGVSVTNAVKFSKLPVGRNELIQVAKETEGNKVSPAIIDEIGQRIDPSPADEQKPEESLPILEQLSLSTETKAEKASAKIGASITPAKEKTEAQEDSNLGESMTSVIDGALSKFYEARESKETENSELASELATVKARLETLLNTIRTIKDKYEPASRADQVSRTNVATLLAAYYSIPVPATKFEEGEESWVGELRLLVSEKTKADISPMQCVAFVQGWVAFIEGHKSDADFDNYKALLANKSLVQKGVETVKRFWHAGYNMAKERNL